MSDMKELISATAEKLFSDEISPEVLRAAETGEGGVDLWKAIEDNGLSRVLLPADQGGADGDWEDAGVLIFASGYHGCPVPLADTIVASQFLNSAGLHVPDGPMVVTRIDPQGNMLLKADLGASDHVVGVFEADGKWQCGLWACAELDFVAGQNMAAENRSKSVLNLSDAKATGELPDHLDGDSVTCLGAMVRAGQLAGAVARVLDLSVQYANERQQFGKLIGKFQAVQQQLAVLASETAAAQKAAETAFHTAAHHGPNATDIAIAKIRCGEAAEKGGRIAHAVHGAIGITYEHQLHFFTRRIWSWRTEFGSDSVWSQRLGKAVFAAGAEALWPSITSDGIAVSVT